MLLPTRKQTVQKVGCVNSKSTLELYLMYKLYLSKLYISMLCVRAAQSQNGLDPPPVFSGVALLSLQARIGRWSLQERRCGKPAMAQEAPIVIIELRIMGKVWVKSKNIFC